jgi:hypothetical protein
MSTATEAPGRPADDGPTDLVPDRRSPGQAIVVLAVSAALVAIAFVTGGGVDDTIATPGNTWTEIAITLIVAVAGAVVLLHGDLRGRRRYGAVTVFLVALLFALQAASIAWSVAPDSSWLASGQMLAYLATFAAAVTCARLAPDRWPTLMAALIVSTVALGGWSLLVKVFPAALAPANDIGRLQAPFGYWNALALTAAMGVPVCMWLGARRDGGRRLAGLAAPALALLVAVLVLSSSRSADAAAAVGAGLWLLFVPLRLRAIAVLALGCAGGAVISAWALVHQAISANDVAMAAQNHAGHIFGVVIVVVLVLVTVGGIAVTDAMDRSDVPEATRRRLGNGLLGLLLIGVAAAALGVATSPRGLSGEISSHWQQLTNPIGTVSASSASRVFQFGSSRPLYWHEALAVGDHDVLHGVGELGFSVARTRYNTSPAVVQQAHSFVFETYADLGIIGLAVVAALLVAWLLASGRTLSPRRPWRALSAQQASERVAMITLAAAVVAFGVQSTLDWTWFFTGISVPALLAAGWLAGRGPVLDGVAPGARRAAATWLDSPGAAGVAILLVAGALLASWTMWRPLHSAQLMNSAENTGSLADARAAQAADPLSLAAFQLLADFDVDAHRPAQAQAVLERSVRVQPQNPYAWSGLATFYLDRHQWRSAVLPMHEVNFFDRTLDALWQLTHNQETIVSEHLPPS